MSTPLSFDKFTVKKLQDFLRERGVSTTGYNKERLVKLATAVGGLNLPVDPDLSGPSHSVDATLRDKLHRAGCNFADPSNLPGFNTTLENIPDFGIYDIFNYLVLNRTDYDRRKLKAFKSFEDYRLFVDGHVEELEFNEVDQSSNVCVFRAKVKPTQKDRTYLNKPTYAVWLVMSKTTGEVSVAYCECPGGSDGACRHLAAVLYEIEAFDKKACTEGPAQWKKKARRHDVPTQLDNLQVTQARYGGAGPPHQTSDKIEFDPRMVDDRAPCDAERMKKFSTSLAQIQPTSSALEFLPGAPEPPKKTNPACVSHLSVKTKIQSGTNPDFHYTPEEVTTLEGRTRGQSTEEEWHNMRRGRLTASNFHAILHSRKEGGGSLAERIVNGSRMEHLPAAIVWGQKKEKAALKQYRRAAKVQHKKLVIRDSGLVVMEKCGYVGASPDGVATCKCKDCKGKWLIEIKCPYTLRDVHPKDAAMQKGCKLVNEELVCPEECQYYAQVQGQMGVCGIERCDLVVYTNKGICCVIIPFDTNYFMKLMDVLKDFFTKNILPKLLE